MTTTSLTTTDEFAARFAELGERATRVEAEYSAAVKRIGEDRNRLLAEIRELEESSAAALPLAEQDAIFEWFDAGLPDTLRADMY